MRSGELFAEGAVERIFNGEVKPHLNKQTGEVAHYAVNGFRLEDASVMREFACSVEETTRTKPDRFGTYGAGVIVRGFQRRVRRSWFFPRGMTRGEVLTIISEAYEHRGVINSKGRKCLGRASSGLEVWLWLDESGRIYDAMPKYQLGATRKQGLLIQCDKCGAYKERMYVCQRHDLPPYLYRRARSKFRRAYYEMRRVLARWAGWDEPEWMKLRHRRR